MNGDVHERMLKVEALTRSPVAGEAAAARAMLAKMEAKHGALPRGRNQKNSSLADLVAQHEATMRAFADAAARVQEHGDFDAFVKRKLEEMLAIPVERAADWLIEHGEACVQVGEGWLMASSGTRVCMPSEVVARAKARGMRR